MRNRLLDKFQLKFNLDDDFINIVSSLFEKLLDFGYISRRTEYKLIQNLNDNVNYLFFGSDGDHDYKSGFYDADKKTMYIQDKNSVSAIYLRLLYAITSSEININTHNMGFSTTYMSSTSYKLMYRNFALNRAVIANLVCRLTNNNIGNIHLVPSYKTYSHNFFGYEIYADNDIYSFEGAILSQMCFSAGIDEELFYSHLFSKNPVSSMNKMFDKIKFINRIDFLTLFDNTSRNYSTYCKLNYFSSILNKNYTERRKKNLTDKKREVLELEEARISKKIKNYIKSLDKNSTNNAPDDFDYELETSLAATLETLEKDILESTIKMQDILASNIITGISYLSPYLYANKLKEFSSLIIMPNKKLDDAIYHTIMFKLVPDHETTTTNIIQKIRYCLISNVLETEKLTKVSNKIVFNKIDNEIAGENEEIAIVTVNNIFASVIKISDINKPIHSLKNNTTNIETNNLKHIKNIDLAGQNNDKINQIFSYLKNYFVYLKKVSMDNVFIFNILNKEYILASTNNNVFVFKLELNKDESGKEIYSLEPLNLSDSFSLFDLSKKKQNISGLPTLYKEKSKLFGLLSI